MALSVSANAFSLLELRGQGTSIHGTHNLIYDADRDITWYDFTNAGAWHEQIGWVDTLSVDFDGTIFSDWRLPTALNQDGTGPDLGLNITGSEMGHLYYTEFGNVASGGLTSTGDFQNLLSSGYWSGTVFDPFSAWMFAFNDGFQAENGKSSGGFALAVRDGDVAAGAASVPEPGTVVLMGLGLVGMVVYGVRKRLQRG